MPADEPIIDASASDSLAVAPPPSEDAASGADADASAGGNPRPPKIRTAMDASDHEGLAAHPEDEDAKLDVALDESFPTSDAPANTQPGKGMDPAPSSGFDADAEKARMAAKE